MAQEDKEESELSVDLEDKLEALRVLLNNSKVEQAAHFKKGELGKNCSYYVKSMMLFEKLEKEEILKLIQEIATEENNG